MGFKPNNMASFVNHYNAKLNTCFVQVDSMDISNPKVIWTHRVVSDAFEGKSYGQYDWHTEKDKKYWDVPPFHCSVVSLGGEEQTCTSDDEFKNLVKVYMGD